MMNRWFSTFVMCASLAFRPSGVSHAEDQARENDLFPVARNIDLLGDVYREVSDSYVDPVDAAEFMFAGIDGMLETLDPYTVFLDREESEELGEITSGQYGGIGVTIATIADRVYVVSVLEGYAADLAGLRTGDRIMAVDGVEMTGDAIEKVRDLLKGVPGTSLEMTVLRCGSPDELTISLMRQEVRVNTVRHASLIGSTGYLEMTSFGNRSAEEVSHAIDGLRAEAEAAGRTMDSVILDLRSNPGGLLDVAVGVTGLFVRKGSEVVSIRGRGSDSRNSYVTETDPAIGSLPLAVLINSRSASASEIVAGAIQEHDRGVVIGERSFGKGLVQSIIPLPYDCKLKMTSARYYTPSGRLIQKYHEPDAAARSVLEHTGRQDSSKVFYTLQNRRKVYGGGGILPDILVSDREAGEYEAALKKEGMLFRYACFYHARNSVQPAIPMDRASLLAGFEEFLEREEFDFEPRPVWMLDDMGDAVGEFGESPRIDSLLTEVERELQVLLERRKLEEREQIAISLEEEILRHYDEDASRRLGVSHDPVVIEALDVLGSQDRYRTLLDP
ncbi:MAG: S41 family peptidase [Prosthecochloris sp.]|nr:S41 family peptidase [Prosthecochloris sp.]